MRDFGEVEALLNTRDEQRPVRRQHHLPPERYRATDVGFFVTLCAWQHGDPFEIRPLAEGIIEALEHRRRQGVWWLYAFCLMPDHLHAVVQLREVVRGAGAPRDLLEVMGDFRSFTTRRAWDCGLRGRLWQHDQYDRLLRDDREFRTRCQYTLDNPVRKGWVEDWSEWPYSGIPDPW